MRIRRFTHLLTLVAISLLMVGMTTRTATAQQATVLADSGFRPDANGLPFENYGEGFTNLTPADMQRMFGDAVCGSKADGKCILNPVAAEWMDKANKAMSGGHCYGFSVFALEGFMGQTDVSKFGADKFSSLILDKNTALQQELAIAWTSQKFDAVREKALVGPPNAILKTLADVFKQGKNAPEQYTIGFFKRDGNGGHAVTPYAIEDRGNGMVALMIYDNNYPKVPREMMFDTNKNSWSYNAAINPNEPVGLYDGDAQTLSLLLFPTTPAKGTQPCPFCGGGSARAGGLALQTVAYNEISLESDKEGLAHLLLTDAAGHKTGYVDGKIVNEIPGVVIQREFSSDLWKDGQDPTYKVPITTAVTITLDGTALKAPASSTVYIIGPGHSATVEGVNLDPGQVDTIDIDANGDVLSYTTKSDESPDLILGFVNPGADYEFTVKGVAMQGGGTVSVKLDTAKNMLIIGSKTGKAGTFNYVMSRIDDKGEEVFEDDNLAIEPGESIYIDYSKWDGTAAGTIEVQIDKGDGSLQPGPKLQNEKK